ncbi:MAG: hypothetical protein ACRCUZ_14315 [Shewanella sp.]
MSSFIAIALTLLVSLALSVLDFAWQPDAAFTGTLYTISSIMFSIGLGVVATSAPHGVKNAEVIKHYRHGINAVQVGFISQFALATMLFFLHQYVFMQMNWQWPYFRLGILASVAQVVTTAFFTLNFLQIKRLNEQIFDRLLREMP